MEQHWLGFLKGTISQIIGLKKYWKVLCGFVSRVSLLNETREARQIENMTKYLQAVAKQLVVMKRSGCSEEVIRDLAIKLNVPVIQANLEAMIVARQFEVQKSAPDATDTQSGKAASPDASSTEGVSRPDSP